MKLLKLEMSVEAEPGNAGEQPDRNRPANLNSSEVGIC
jgi:hypothetical protein